MQNTPLLKVIDQFGVRRTFPLSKSEFTIGRRVENDLQVMSNSVSRYHGAIVREQGDYYLVDKGSKTGLFINNEKVERGVLHHLDRIRLGGADDYDIQFVVPEYEAAKSSGAEAPSGMHSAINATEELKNLARYVEVNQAFKFSLSPEDVLRLIVDAAVELGSAERGVILLKNKAGELEFKVARDGSKKDVARKDFSLSTSAVKEVLRKNKTIVVNEDDHGSFEVGHSVAFLKLRTIICVPLHRFQMRANMEMTSMLQQELIGVLYLHSSKATAGLSYTSRSLLESLAFEASKCLENVRLMHEEQEKQKLEREIELARDVQVALLPAGFIESNLFELAAESIPCRHVGGDFYDFMTMPDGRVVLTLADVSGKGISAALLASLAQGVIDAQFLAGQSPAEVLGNLNRVIVNRSDANRFVTMFTAVLDTDGTFNWVNAGHNPPMLLRGGSDEIEMLTTGSLILGAFDFAGYDDSHIKLNTGDVFFSFSDGVTEAVNTHGELFGDDRLLDLLKASIKLSAKEIKDRVLGEVLSFTRGLPQGDDITVVALKIK
jgi:serine phosphatase RsbU (regulator of sigma subunit)/pSer/pThr/pTyr-binding forkhead associated (FHA) protein